MKWRALQSQCKVGELFLHEAKRRGVSAISLMLVYTQWFVKDFFWGGVMIFCLLVAQLYEPLTSGCGVFFFLSARLDGFY